MTKEEFLNAIQEIGTCEDDATRRASLAELSENVSSVFDDNTSLTERVSQFERDNETLREANMKLFLRVGENKEPDTKKVEEKPEEKLKFEDLLDEKGGLK